MADAARAPKTKARRINVSGIDTISAIFKSEAIFSEMAFPTTETPPGYKVKLPYLPSYLSWKTAPSSWLSGENASASP